MNRLTKEEQVQIIGMLVEGMSLRAITRLTGVSINTATKLLIDIGIAAADYQDKTLRNLTCQRIQCDEIWAFCYAKEKNVPADKKGKFGYGDVWTWTAIDADTKLIPVWTLGNRDARTDRKSTRLNSSHANISYAVFCLKKTQQHKLSQRRRTNHAPPDTLERHAPAG